MTFCDSCFVLISSVATLAAAVVVFVVDVAGGVKLEKEAVGASAANARVVISSIDPATSLTASGVLGVGGAIIVVVKIAPPFNHIFGCR